MEHYIHRVGRTARAGKAGVSVSLAGEQERKIVKDIIKNAVNPVKNRIIPTEIIEKYRKKVELLEEEIEKVLQEEHAEKMLRQAEAQLSKTEKKLKGVQEDKRLWFQSGKERNEEKERLSIKPTEPKENPKESKKKRKRDEDDFDPVKFHLAKKEKMAKKKKQEKQTPELSAKDRAIQELAKVSLVQAKLSKIKNRNRKINAVDEEPDNRGRQQHRGQQKSSRFERDLTDVSKKKVKNLRYDASKKKKMDKLSKDKFKSVKVSGEKLKNKAGLNKQNKGKFFGGPKKKGTKEKKKNF